MKFLSKECKINISADLQILSDESLLNPTDGEDYIKSGFYIKQDNNVYKINKNDLKNWKYNPAVKLSGCCGIDGTNGPNLICKNNHIIGTEKSDCWMPHFIELIAKKVILSK